MEEEILNLKEEIEAINKSMKTATTDLKGVSNDQAKQKVVLMEMEIQKLQKKNDLLQSQVKQISTEKVNK